MQIQVKKLADLNPAPYNPRKSDKKQEENLTASLEKFGVVEPIIFNERTGNIVGGHFRVRQLIKMGKTEAPCVVLDLSPEDEKELNIRLNANTGSWDWELLATDWDKDKLEEWGLELPDDFMGETLDEEQPTEDGEDFSIVLKYQDDYEYKSVKAALNDIDDSPEKAVRILLDYYHSI